MTRKSRPKPDEVEGSDGSDVRLRRLAGGAPPGMDGIPLPEKATPAMGCLSEVRSRAIAAALDGPVAGRDAVPGPGEADGRGDDGEGIGRARRRADRADEEGRLMRAFADIREAAAREHLLSLAEALATLSRARPRSS
jgi:hypothetical protein